MTHSPAQASFFSAIENKDACGVISALFDREKEIKKEKEQPTMTTTYNAAQKQAETKFSLGAAQEKFGGRMGERILTIKTHKRDSSLVTIAEVSLHTSTGFSHAFALGGEGGDYRVTLQTVPCSRATEKAIMAAHASAEPQFQAVLAAATAHYQAEAI